MAKVLSISGNHNQASATTAWKFLVGQGTIQTNAENQSQVRIKNSGGVFDTLTVHVGVNSLDGTATVTFRNNAGAGNQTVSISATATGLFQDTTHTDTVASGDLVNYQIVTAGTTGTGQFDYIQTTFSATTSTMQRLLVSTIINDTNPTIYAAFNSSGSDATLTETNAQFKFKCAGTIKNGYTRIRTNTQTNTVTFRSRVGGANGNIAIPVTTLATGIFEDISNSDTITSGNLVNLAVTGGDSLNSIIADGFSVEFVTTDSTFQMISGENSDTGVAFTAGSTVYVVPGCNLFTQNSTESRRQPKTSFAFTASNLEIFVAVNGGTTNGALTFRLNTAATALTVSVTALTTGYFEDTTHTVSVASGDLISLEYVAGATADTNIGNLGFKATGTATPSVTTIIPRMTLLGIG